MSDDASSGPAEPVSAKAPPLESRVWMTQDWRDLASLHWAVDPALVAHRMPAGVRPDEHDGRTFVGLVPFSLVGAAVGRGPAVPWLGTFLETNVRLYSVDVTGRRGVVFLSLDCERALVAAGARAAVGTPYRWARMRHRVGHRTPGSPPTGEVHTWTATRRDPLGRLRGPSSRVRLRVGAPREPGPLDHFLSARWGLHSRLLGRTRYLPNEHPPWPLHDAELLEADDELVAAAGLGDLAARPPDHVAFSPGVHTTFGFPVDARQPRGSGSGTAGNGKRKHRTIRGA